MPEPEPIDRAEAMTFLDRTFPTIEQDLAADEALLARADDRDGPPALRLWEPPRVAVVLGATCRYREAARVDACERDGVPILRRSSGGGSVVIGPGALNVAVVLPIAALPGYAAVDTAQKVVLERLAAAIRREGPDVRMLGSGDLTLDGRKVSGSAQRRLRRWFLVHATILYDFPLGLIGEYLGPPRREPEYRAGRDHLDFVTNLGLPRDALVRAARAAWFDDAATPATAEVDETLMADLVREKFGDRGWVERF